MDKIKQQLNKLTSEIRGLKKENKELSTKIKELEKRIPPTPKANTQSDDELYSDAKREIIKAGKVSTSFLQRKFGIGYARASMLMDMFEEKGVIDQGHGSKPRKVLIKLK